MSLKIGLLVGSLNGAGAEKTILTLASALQAIGNRVVLVVLSSRHKDYSVSDIDEVIFIDQKKRSQIKSSLIEVTSENNFDLFITSRAEFYQYVQAKVKLCSVHITPTAWLKKRSLLMSWKTFFQKLKLKRKFAGKNLIALSEGIKKDLIDNLGVNKDCVTVIPNPFDFECIQSFAMEECTLESEDFIVYVASLIPRKRHFDLLEAFSRLQNTSIKLVLIGKGELEKEIKKKAHELGVGNRVVFLGWVANPYKYIKNAKLSVLVSEAEGLPRILVESMILEVPIVSTNCPSGPSELMMDELKDYLVEVGDIDAIAAAINRALTNYPEYLPSHNIERFRNLNVAQKYIESLEHVKKNHC